MDSNAGCFVEFNAPCSQASPVFFQFFVHCTISLYHSTTPALLWPLLQLLLNQLILSARFYFKRNYHFEFLNNFLSVVIGPTTFFLALECPELLQRYWCTVIVLVKKLCKQSAIFRWDRHSEFLKHEKSKSPAP